MQAARWVKSGSVAFATFALALLVHCSGDHIKDGEECKISNDCESGRCTGGTCEGSDCTCQGSDCRGRSSCLEGWLCTRGEAISSGDVIPQCRKQCTGAGTCPSDKHCSNGVCRSGPEPFALTWESFPRTVACGAGVPCKYKVHVPEGVTVDTFTWTFGDAPLVDTKEPMTEFTYAKTGTYSVHVHARATSGATADLEAAEVLCEGGIGSPCDASGAPCCEGSCNAKSVCQ